MAMTHIAAMRMLTELNRLSPHVSPAGVAIAGTISTKLLRAFADRLKRWRNSAALPCRWCGWSG
jgi:hypothetical protein